MIGGSVNTGCYGGIQVPDFVANIRLDQTWGSAQVMGAVHQVNATYYGNGVSFEGTTAPLNGAVENRTLGTNGNLVTASGHPGDEWGWVVGAGLRLNFPSIAQGDYFQGEVNYTQGALTLSADGQQLAQLWLGARQHAGLRHNERLCVRLEHPRKRHHAQLTGHGRHWLPSDDSLEPQCVL